MSGCVSEINIQMNVIEQKKVKSCALWAVVVAQLVERSLPIPDIRD